MTSMRAVVVAGLAAAAATGLAAPAFAAPAKPAPRPAPAPAAKTAKAPVTTDQCTAANGRVQRAKDGVGTCVGGKSDGHLIKDVGMRRADGTTTSPEYASTNDPRYSQGYEDGRRESERRGLFGSSNDRRSDDRRSDDRSSDNRGSDRTGDGSSDRGTDRSSDSDN